MTEDSALAGPFLRQGTWSLLPDKTLCDISKEQEWEKKSN